MDIEIRKAIWDGNLPVVLNYLDEDWSSDIRRKRVGNVLRLALRADQKTLLTHLLEEEFDVNSGLPAYTLLIMAAQQGNADFIQALLARGADVNAIDHLGSTALCEAAQAGNLDIVILLLDHGADPNLKEEASSPSAVLRAIENGRGHFAVAKVLLERGADVNEVIRGTPLIVTMAKEGQTKIVKVIIKQGVGINAREERSGRTALQCAADGGNVALTKLLLNAGADPALRDSYGHSPLYEAVRRNHVEVVRALLEAEPNPSGEGNIQERTNILADAVDCRRKEVARLLLEHGGSPNIRSEGLPLLISAIKNSYCREEPVDLVRLLLDCGADVNARDANGWTAWTWANAYKNLAVVELLESRGAKVDAVWPVPLEDSTLAIVQNAQAVETFRVTSAQEERERGTVDISGFPVTASGPVLGADFAAKVEALLTDHRTYMGEKMLCGFEPGVAFRLQSTQGQVTILICFKCLEMLLITLQEDRIVPQHLAQFHPISQSVFALAQEAFPDDPEIMMLG